MSKAVWIYSFGIVAVMVFGYIIHLPLLVLLAAIAICLLILFSSFETATCALFFFAAFSQIIAFKEVNLCILPAVSYIVKYVLTKSIRMSDLYAFPILIYCLIFANPSGTMKLGTWIYPILLLLPIVICNATERTLYPRIIRSFMAGFVLAAIIGFFKAKIPDMAVLFEEDALYISGVETTLNIRRYAGLSYDPNFFVLTDCILISILLFSSKKMRTSELLTLLFLVVAGFFTFSKSYMLVLAVIGIVYVLKNGAHVLHVAGVILCCAVLVLLAENYTSIKVITLINARFTTSNGLNDLTTGRLSIWGTYLSYLGKNLNCLVFGRGFNAFSLRKAVHNTFLDSLYRFGIVGSALWYVHLRNCVSAVSARFSKANKKNWMPAAVCIALLTFLSAFHFQQLWCCICLVLFSLYQTEEEQDIATEHSGSGLQRGLHTAALRGQHTKSNLYGF